MRRLLALVVVALLAAPASAAQRPQVVDPSGDAVTAQAAQDIVSVTVEITRTVTTSRVHGRVVRRSVPKDLVVTLRVAGPVDTAHDTAYQVTTLTPCGTSRMTAYGTPAGQTVSYDAGVCSAGGGHENVAVTPAVRTTGNAIAWSVPYARFNLPPGGWFYGIRAATTIGEPVTGGTALAGSAPAIDAASTDVRWYYGP